MFLILENSRFLATIFCCEWNFIIFVFKIEKYVFNITPISNYEIEQKYY